jgi:hypothetical protein
MFGLHFQLRSAILAIAALIAVSGSAYSAGLVGYRNDTNEPVIVQSAVVVNNTVRRSKPQLLYPGEIAVDGLTATGIRRISLYDPKKPNTALHQEDVDATKDVFLSIQRDTTVMVKEKPANPVYKLVPTRIPTMPSKPGPGMPGPGVKPPTNPPPPPPKKK